MPYADREAQKEYQRHWMKARRVEALDGKSCSFCGGTERLEFHHWDPGAKESHAVWSWSKKRRDAELAKCVVLCNACHVQRHREARPNFCGRGHEFTPANTYLKPSTGRRECRACRALRRQAA